MVEGLQALGHRVRQRELPWGGAQIVAAEEAGIQPLLDELFRLHRLRWSGRGSPGVLDDPVVLAIPANYPADGPVPLAELAGQPFLAPRQHHHVQAPGGCFVGEGRTETHRRSGDDRPGPVLLRKGHQPTK